MGTTLLCPACKSELPAADGLAGMTVRCQHCGHVVDISASVGNAPTGTAGITASPPPLAPSSKERNWPRDDRDTPRKSSSGDVGMIVGLVLACLLLATCVLGGIAAFVGFFFVGVARMDHMAVEVQEAPAVVADKVAAPAPVKKDDPVPVKKVEMAKDERPPLAPVPVDFVDGKAVVKAGELMRPGPDFNAGRLVVDGSYRLFSVKLAKDRRYNCYVKSAGFTPRLQIYQGDALVADRQALVPLDHVFLSLVTKNAGEYQVLITSPKQRFGGVFEMTVAPLSKPPPTQVDLKAAPQYSVKHELRVDDAIDPAAPSDFGPSREYVVNLEAKKDCVLTVNSTDFQAVVTIYDAKLAKQKQFINHFFADKTEEHLWPVPTAGEYRIRVSSATGGLGSYELHLSQREGKK